MLQGLPTKQRLLALKRRGIVSVSGLAIRAVSLVVVLVGFLVTIPRAASEIERVCRQGLVWRQSNFVDSTARIIIATSLGVVIAAVLSTILQSRGALGWGLLVATRKRRQGIARVISYLSVLGGAVILAAALILANTRDFLSLLRAREVSQAANGYAFVLASNVKLVVVGAVVCAILSSALTRFFFLVKNRARSGRGAD
jgi:hypothetical protein